MVYVALVLFINGRSEGHINPTIGVVQELILRGEEVVYFCIEAFRERMEKTGASVRTFDDQKFIKAFISVELIDGKLYFMRYSGNLHIEIYPVGEGRFARRYSDQIHPYSIAENENGKMTFFGYIKDNTANK